MKKLVFLLFCMSGLFMVNAQNADKTWSLEVQFGKNEYKGDIVNDFFKWNKAFYEMGGIGLNHYLNKSFDLGLLGTYGRYGGYRNSIIRFIGYKFDGSLLLKYKLNNGYILSEKAFIAPYLTAGAGFANFPSGMSIVDGTNFIIPMGVGIKFNITRNFALQYQSLFNLNYSDVRDNRRTDGKYDNYMKHTLGLVFSFGGKKDADKDGVSDKYDLCPNTPLNVKVDANGCPVDSDHDGVADYLDKCPDTPANVAVDASGCPKDSDGDGIADYLDACPNAKGSVALNGCPDSDNDGVADKDDKCPNTPKGIKVDVNGCPIDTDGDGVPDYLDKCPNEKGLKENKGCPEVKKETKELFNKALQGIQFETGKDVIRSGSNPILDAVVKVMNNNPSYLLQINGHTDNVGKPEANKLLSEKRAMAVKNYLVSKGVSESRLKTAGYGDTKPVADNKTPAGKKLNRRVEFNVEF